MQPQMGWYSSNAGEVELDRGDGWGESWGKALLRWRWKRKTAGLKDRSGLPSR